MTVLAVVAIFVAISIYVFYWKGLWVRERSNLALTLASDQKAKGGTMGERVGDVGGEG